MMANGLGHSFPIGRRKTTAGPVVPVSPVLLSAAYDGEAYVVTLTFSKDMSRTITGAEFTLSGTKSEIVYADITDNQVALNLSDPLISHDDPSISYDGIIPVYSTDGGLLGAFSDTYIPIET